MPANRKDRHLTGSFKPSQAAPVLAYSRPKDGELTDEQELLLQQRPKRLTQAEKLEYRRKVIDAPWLTSGDRDLLVLWIQARSRYEVSVRAYDRLLRDPEFALPGSAVAKAAVPLGRLQHREAMTMLNLAHRLGFSPAGRLALGVDTRKPPAAEGDDPWAELRLVKR